LSIVKNNYCSEKIKPVSLQQLRKTNKNNTGGIRKALNRVGIKLK
jgi:hypothetical protein